MQLELAKTLCSEMELMSKRPPDSTGGKNASWPGRSSPISMRTADPASGNPGPLL